MLDSLEKFPLYFKTAIGYYDTLGFILLVNVLLLSVLLVVDTLSVIQELQVCYYWIYQNFFSQDKHRLTSEHKNFLVFLSQDGFLLDMRKPNPQTPMSLDEFMYLISKIGSFNYIFNKRYYMSYYPLDPNCVCKSIFWLEDRHFSLLYNYDYSPPPLEVYQYYQDYFPQFLESQKLLLRAKRRRSDTL